MITIRMFLGALGSLLVLNACNNSAPTAKTAATPSFNLDSVKMTIQACNEKFSEAFVKGDSATIVGLYHSECRAMPPNMAAMTGGASMGSMIAGMPKMGVKTMKVQTTELMGNSDQVIDIGTYEMGDGTKTIDKGKYIVIWKPENGQWKMYRDIWNSDMPPPAPAAK